MFLDFGVVTLLFLGVSSSLATVVVGGGGVVGDTASAVGWADVGCVALDVAGCGGSFGGGDSYSIV